LRGRRHSHSRRHDDRQTGVGLAGTPVFSCAKR
jgi:hypothetical protein